MAATDDRTIPPATTERDQITYWAGVALILAAFGMSYSHVATWVTEHGQAAAAGYVTAFIPEVMVGVSMRRLNIGQGNVAAWLSLAVGAAFTVAGNLAEAEPSWPGRFVAVLPAVAAALGMWMAGGHKRVAPPVAEVAPVKAARPKVAPKAAAPIVASVASDGPVVAEATVATVRAAWEASGRAMTDEAIAEGLGISKAAARSRRRGWDGSKKTPVRANQVVAS